MQRQLLQSKPVSTHEGVRDGLQLAAEYSDKEGESRWLVVTQDGFEGVTSQPGAHWARDGETRGQVALEGRREGGGGECEDGL